MPTDPRRDAQAPEVPDRELVRPEVVDPSAEGPETDGEADTEQVTRPTKLIRIASMVRTMLDEVRRAPLDDAGRRRLREIHERSLEELEGVLSPDLRKELAGGRPPVHERDTDRVGAAPRAGPARRLARRPLPRHPGDALHPAGDGAVAARGDAPPALDRDGPGPGPGAGHARARHPAQRLPLDIRSSSTMTTSPLFASDWAPGSWRARPAAQQPDWPDPAALEAVLDEIRTMPPLVFAGEARNLSQSLAAAQDGRAFLLVAGDCAESFDAFSADGIRDKLKIILQMSVVLTYGSGVPTLKVGRMAGQFSKPRSAATETRDGIELPSFRGDTVNDFAFDAAARRPDPARLMRAYHQSASTLNLARAFTKGGFADLTRVHAWNQEFVAASPEGQRYEALADEIERALRFMARVRHRPRRRAPAPPGRLLDRARGAAPRLRGGADPARQHHRRLVRLLGPPALDRRPDPPARRRARRVPLGRPQPDRGEAGPRRRAPRGRRRCASA